MRGQPGQNIHARSFLGIDNLTTQRNVALIREARGLLVCLAYSFWHVFYVRVYTQALADVRSTGAEIKWLYCRSRNSSNPNQWSAGGVHPE